MCIATTYISFCVLDVFYRRFNVCPGKSWFVRQGHHCTRKGCAQDRADFTARKSFRRFRCALDEIRTLGHAIAPGCIEDVSTGVAVPVLTGVFEGQALEDMLRREAGTAIRPTPLVRYVYDEVTRHIQTVFIDQKTGKVLDKVPTDAVMALDRTLLDWARDTFVDESV